MCICEVIDISPGNLDSSLFFIQPSISHDVLCNIALTYSFPDLEPVCCSMSSSNCCFLICIQISQEAGQVVWYSHLFRNFPQFIVIHTVKGSGIVNKAKVDGFLELSCFFDDPTDVAPRCQGLRSCVEPVPEPEDSSPVLTWIWGYFWRKWQPTPVLLPGKSRGRRSLVGCSPWGHKESDTTK